MRQPWGIRQPHPPEAVRATEAFEAVSVAADGVTVLAAEAADSVSQSTSNTDAPAANAAAKETSEKVFIFMG